MKPAPILALTLLPSWAGALELTGDITAESRTFVSSAAHAGQHNEAFDLSLAFQPEVYHEFKDSDLTFTFTPFFRFDHQDDERTHFDVRELFLQKTWDNGIELSLGARQVFWGVTESVHLVDVINQTDLVENLDTEDKLGQPMLQLAVPTDYGTFEAFVLPGFRERTFPGREGRLRTPLVADTDNALYQSAAGEWHLDSAVRYSHTIGDIDFGLSHFYGTSREPDFVLSPDGGSLLPRYDVVHQSGLDLQYTLDAWLWKLEAVSVAGRGDWFWQGAAGLEYTFFDIAGSGIDIGLLAEYLHDSRGTDENPSPFQEDIFFGTRLAFNDDKDTAVLAGAVWDPDYGSTLINLEASRRLTDHWSIEFELRAFTNVSTRDPLHAFENDSYVSLSLSRYF